MIPYLVPVLVFLAVLALPCLVLYIVRDVYPEDRRSNSA